MLILDQWQKNVLATKGMENIVVRSGRQCGKSTVIAVLAGDYAAENKHKVVMIVSATERQAYLLFSKVLAYIYDNYKTLIKKGKDRPTKSEIKLLNGTKILCLPTGLDGTGIRGYTVDLLIADECAMIPNDVFPAITPMIATTGGKMVLLSTPRGTGNYFYEAFYNPAFKTFHVSSEDCERIPKDFLESEKKRMTALEYMQEYKGEFSDKVRQLFSDDLIKACMQVERGFGSKGDFYLGVDVARMGGDECTFEIVRKNEDNLIHVENIATENIMIPDTINKILELESQYIFQKIYIDTGGMGVAVFDFLLRNDITRRKVVAIDNATRPIERPVFGSKPRKRTLMKTQLYMNLKRIMEQGKIKLLKDENIFFSLKSVQVDYTKDGELKIISSYGHIAEGLIRAVHCSNEKSLNLWIDGM